MLDTILSIQPKDSSGGYGETRESVVYRLCDDMIDKLPGDYDPFEVSESHECGYQHRNNNYFHFYLM